MARQPCPQVPGVALHVVLRGDPVEPEAGLARLGAALDCPLHAYVLMGTHAHLLLTPARAGGASALAGALAAREFDASPVRAWRYFIACMRYIELNPVRAGIVRQPAQYPWSSYRANALGEEDALVTPHPWYYALGRTPQARRAAWRARTRG
jgi:putative transposase